MHLRLGYKIKVTDRISLVPIAGVSMGINTDGYIGSGRGYGTARSNSTTIVYAYEENDDVSGFIAMFYPALELDWKLSESFLLAVWAGRGFGFIKVHQLDITYTVNNDPSSTAKLIGYGEYSCLGLSLKYRISKLWTNPETK